MIGTKLVESTGSQRAVSAVLFKQQFSIITCDFKNCGLTGGIFYQSVNDFTVVMTWLCLQDGTCLKNT